MEAKDCQGLARDSKKGRLVAHRGFVFPYKLLLKSPFLSHNLTTRKPHLPFIGQTQDHTHFPTLD